MKTNLSAKAFILGFIILFTELILIRWLGGQVRLVGYFSNFVVIATFLGLGTGALFTSRIKISKIWTPISLTVLLVLAPLLGLFKDSSIDSIEFIWLGKPQGMTRVLTSLEKVMHEIAANPYLILAVLFLLAFVYFFLLGHLLGEVFSKAKKDTLKIYGMEILGSLIGIIVFTIMSFAQAMPIIWFLLAMCVFLLIDQNHKFKAVVIIIAIIGSLTIIGFDNKMLWSPYYKIDVRPLEYSKDFEHMEKIKGHSVYVNNDYYQMMLDLENSSSNKSGTFIEKYKWIYSLPYFDAEKLPPGKILIIGAGTGNDVVQAIELTQRDIIAVDIDPVILDIGKRLHPNHPYQNPRVQIINNDARNFLETTDEKFALIVFAYLDSHTLLSSFSSVRIDNFIYTKEMIKKARSLLVKNGRVSMTFCSPRPWLTNRLALLMLSSFSERVLHNSVRDLCTDNFLAANDTHQPLKIDNNSIPTDDWPFLYLSERGIPLQYKFFLGFILLLSILFYSLAGRKLKLPIPRYLLLGTGFFAIESHLIVRSALNFGSTWITNSFVFIFVLLLVFIANTLILKYPNLKLKNIFILLAASLFLHQIFQHLPHSNIPVIILQLSILFFSTAIFSKLIAREDNLSIAYGSNVIGAMLGAAIEYGSMLYGFKGLSWAIVGIYFILFFCLKNKFHQKV